MQHRGGASGRQRVGGTSTGHSTRDPTLAGAQLASMAVAHNPTDGSPLRCISERWFRAATLTATIGIVNAITVARRSLTVQRAGQPLLRSSSSRDVAGCPVRSTTAVLTAASSPAATAV